MEKGIAFGIKVLNRSFKDLENQNLGKCGPKIKILSDLMKICTLVNLKVLDTNLTVIFKYFTSKT